MPEPYLKEGESLSIAEVDVANKRARLFDDAGYYYWIENDSNVEFLTEGDTVVVHHVNADSYTFSNDNGTKFTIAHPQTEEPDAI